MASPLAMDLRIRVMDDLDSGMTVDQAAGKYSITSRTIFSWKKLRRETGAVIPRQGKTGSSPTLEPYRNAICAAVKDHSGITLKELKTQLNLPGGLSTLWTALRDWGIVLKKSHLCSRTEAA